MKVGFISDFFASQLNGGAELNDNVLISFLNKKFDIVELLSQECTIDKLSRVDFIIVSNFVGLNIDNMKLSVFFLKFHIYSSNFCFSLFFLYF